jgi:hypothetical protein
MNQTGSSSHRVSNSGWQLLGELDLTINPDVDLKVGRWLAVILSPLDLRAAFMNKILKSAQQAAACTRQVETMMQFQQFKLLVFAPADPASNGFNSTLSV